MNFEFNINFDEAKLNLEVDEIVKAKINKSILYHVNSYDFDRKLANQINKLMTSEHIDKLIIEELQKSEEMKEKIRQSIIKKLTSKINKLMAE